MNKRLLGVWIVAILGLVTACGLHAYQPAQAVATAAAPAAGEGVVSQELSNLSTRKELATFLQSIQTRPKVSGEPATLVSLRKDIDGYFVNEKLRAERDRKEYEKELAELKKNMEAGHLLKALSSAVKAFGMSGDLEAFLANKDVKALIDKTESKAAEFEKAGDWLNALSHYRGLDAIFDTQQKYEEPKKRVTNRIRLMSMYCPKKLFEQSKQQAKEQGEEAPEPWADEDDDWQAQVSRVDKAMLQEALVYGVRDHVEGSTFEKMLAGGIEALESVLDTKGLEESFPSLLEKEKTGPFAAYLKELKTAVAQRAEPMNYLQATTIINQVIRKNNETVKLPEAVVIFEFGDGAMDRLDQFSSIIWHKQKEVFERTTNGSFSGVGIQIRVIDRHLTVVTPLKGSPAHKAGIWPGEEIVTIDGKSTLGISVNKAVDRITGQTGTTVKLGIKPPGADAQVREVTLTRSDIKIESVKGWELKRGGGWNYYVDPERKIGYMRITQFLPETSGEMDRAFQELKDAGGVEGLIIDLRHNPGGLMRTAQEICNRFVKSGRIVGTTPQRAAFRFGNADQWVMASGQQYYGDFPVAVLINKGSASASEIVSGCLKNHNRAIVVGERSYGKGSVQHVIPLTGPIALMKLTTQYYKIPSGQIVHRRPGAEVWGVDPHITIRMSDKQVADLLEAHMLLDVLLDNSDKGFDPTTILSKKQQENEKKGGQPLVRQAKEILDRGMDAQLEVAIMALKSELVKQANMASK